jgi:hypothetical protein
MGLLLLSSFQGDIAQRMKIYLGAIPREGNTRQAQTSMSRSDQHQGIMATMVGVMLMATMSLCRQ